ncbi:MAG TPA: RNA polymerase sigma factor [Polyangiaceae bacterium]|nr:RNA polymerase sigma factor [Polyangiaceae bacterium]
MNISGHENQGATHMSDEEALVEASLQTPAAALPAATGRDSDVLAALKSNDRATAAELLVELHARAIGRTCMALLGSQSEAEDALQETLLAALDGLEAFRNEGTLRAWLLSVARRHCAKRLELRTRERDLRQSLPSSAESAPVAERLSMARRARRLLDEIRPTEREALVLRYAAELSFREVGQACGIDEATARKRVSRGLLRLRSLLGEKKP